MCTGQMSLLSSAVESKKRRVSVGGVNVPSELHNCGTIVHVAKNLKNHSILSKGFSTGAVMRKVGFSGSSV